jgi:hypothetical protein
MHCGCVPDEVRTNSLFDQCWASNFGLLDNLLEDVRDTVTRERATARVGEREGVGAIDFAEPCLKDPRGPRPQGHHPFFTALTMQVDGGVVAEDNLGAPKRGQFGHPRSCVVKRQEKGMVPPPCPLVVVGSSKDRIHLLSCQVANQSLVASFVWDGQDTSGEIQAAGFPQGNEAEERAKGGESCIPGPDTIVTLSFEVIEEGEEGISVEIVEAKRRGLCSPRVE